MNFLRLKRYSVSSRGVTLASCPWRITSGAVVFASDRRPEAIRAPGGEVEDAHHGILGSNRLMASSRRPFLATNRAKGSVREVEGLLTGPRKSGSSHPRV